MPIFSPSPVEQLAEHLEPDLPVEGQRTEGK